MKIHLSDHQIEEFKKNGVLVLKQFYDIKTEINPILVGIHSIIGLLIKENNLPIAQVPFSPDNFDSGYQELIKIDRKLGSVVYDAIKQIPAFIRIVGSEKNELVCRQLRNSENIGISAGGYGIRIDNPDEDKYLTLWHQEYPTHLRSLDGFVFWSPFISMTNELGPVQMCKGSHLEGIAKLFLAGTDKEIKASSYQELAKIMQIHNIETLLKNYPPSTPLINQGDLLVMDFLTVHSSSPNKSNRSRWSIQLRYFNFENAIGKKIKWSGGISSGKTIKEFHPEVFIK